MTYSLPNTSRAMLAYRVKSVTTGSYPLKVNERKAMTRTGYTLSVCADCMVTEAYGAPSEDPSYIPDREPLGLVPAGADISSGCLDCEPCAHPDCGPSPVCGCGYGDPGHGFSWSSCDGCGSSLGGNRYPLVMWEAVNHA